MRNTKFLIKLIFLFACAASVCGGARAQNSLGLTPAMIDADVKPGKTYVQEFTIVNNTGTRLRFRCFVNDYWYGENNEKLITRPGTQPRSASNWVQLSPSEIVIEPHSSGVVKAVISVPESAAGGYYTIPFFEGEAADKPGEDAQKKGTAAASVAVRLGGLLMLATEGKSEYNVSVTDGKIQPPTASSALEMQLNLKNSGTAHARVRGMFVILDAWGKIAGRGRIEEKRFLPGQRDLLSTTWAGELRSGKFTAIVTLSYDRAGQESASLTSEIPFEIP